MEKIETYQLDELIHKLEDIYRQEDDTLNLPKALYTLALEIRKLKPETEEASSISSEK